MQINQSDQTAPASQQAIQQARQAASTPIWIDNAATLHQAASIWQQRSWLAIDTEFIRERTYYAQLGVLQVSDAQTVWLLDTPALRQHQQPIQDLLASSSINKIIHSCSEDLEVLSQQYQVVLAAVHDSQIAAAMLGSPLQMRYENLIGDILGQQLPDGPSRSNWLQRPLSPAQLEYASNDVAYLPLLMQYLQQRLQATERWSWLQQDMQWLLQKAASGNDPQQLYRKVKGYARLDAPALARLQQLAIWRDQQAQAQDLPRSFVLRDEGLMELASVAASPSYADSSLTQLLKQTQSIPARVCQRYQPQWQALFSSPPERQLQPEAPLSRTEKQLLSKAQESVKQHAAQLHVEPALLASRRILTELLIANRQTSAAAQLPGWRGDLLNDALQASLQDTSAD